jgi:hypothetical protein
MAIDPMTLLEKRVHQLLELVKRLKEDNDLLEQKVKMTGNRLAKRERDGIRWNHDRNRLRSKVERILSEMETLTGRLSNAEGRASGRSRKRGAT